MASAVNARRYVIGCVCLLIAAAALRFYNLTEYGHLSDESVAALNSRGDFSEVVDNTRAKNSSPILYPIALWAVQKAQSSDFSIRLVPAAGSALTVGALLLLMPRVGVPRRAAFLAALLCALSVAAIEHAKDAREYSVDALCAALMIAGLLQYLRDGRKGLLCGALAVGPLLQYGLALFGVAVIGVAIVAATPPHSYVRIERLAHHRRIWEWFKRRIGLLLPIGAFAGACALSWGVTLRYQWVEGGFGKRTYLKDYYYQNGFDAAAIAEFAVGRSWDLLSYHMAAAVAAAALIAFGALALASFWRRRRLDAVGLLALFAVGVALCAVLADAYPFGGSRHALYLGPIIFLAAGVAFHSLADDVGALLRRGWVAPALGAAVAVGIAVAGAAEIRQDDRYTNEAARDDSRKRVIAALEDLEREGDVVYVSLVEVPTVEFYKWEKPANYIYGDAYCRRIDIDRRDAAYRAECARALMDDVFSNFKNGSRRIWFIYYKGQGVSIRKEMAEYSQEVMVEEVIGDGHTALYLITGMDELVANIGEYVESAEPSAVSTYNLYLRDNALHYAKRPCAAADTDARFFLHIYPRDAAALPDWRRQYGFDNLDFDFQEHGLTAGDRCLIRRALPGYAIERIHTGQFASGGDVVWEVELWFNP